MKNRLLILAITLSSFASTGQEVISSQGNFIELTSGSVSFTIGESIVHTTTISEGILTQGFQQNYEDFIVSLDDLILSDLLIYPNPFNEGINFRGLHECEILVSDIFGKIVLRSERFSDTFLPLNDLSLGTYFLEIRKEDSIVIKQIIKTNN